MGKSDLTPLAHGQVQRRSTNMSSVWCRALSGGAHIAALGGLCNGLAMGGLGGVLEESEAFKRRFGDGGGRGGLPAALSSDASESLAASLQLGAMGGALLAGSVADRLGRRPAVAVAALLVLLGAAAPLLPPGGNDPSAASPAGTSAAAAAASAAAAAGLATLRAGRIVLGVGIGAVCMVVPMLAAELAPADLRGAIDSAFQLFVAIGIVIAFGFNVQFAGAAQDDDALWRAALALPALPSAALLLLLGSSCSGDGSTGCAGAVGVAESPRWLLQYRGDEDAARRALQHARGGDGAAAKQELDDMLAAAVARRRCTTLEGGGGGGGGGGDGDDDIAEVVGGAGEKESTSWRAVFAPHHRQAVAIACAVLWLQVFTGIDILTQYAAHVFELAGIATKAARLGCNLAIGLVGTAGTALSIRLVESSGRRPLLLWGSAAMAASLALLAAVLAAGARTAAASAAAVGMTFVYVFAFALSWGPVSWIIPCEIVPTAIRAKVLSLGVMLNWLADYIVVGSFLSLKDAAGGVSAVFLIYAAICAGAWLFVYLCVVESKGRSLEDIAVDMRGGEAVAATAVTAEAQEGEKSALIHSVNSSAASNLTCRRPA